MVRCGSGLGAVAGLGVADCFAGLTVQASFSNPGRSFCGGGGPASSSSPFSLLLKALSSTTSLLSRAGAGRPFRVLFRKAPPGPENRPPPISGDPPLSAAEDVSMRFLLRIMACLLLRLYFVSRYFVIRRMSPSLRPRVRKTEGVISGRIDSSIESFLKL